MYQPIRRGLKASIWMLALSGLFVVGASAAVPELTPEMEKAFRQAGWDAQQSSDGSLTLRRVAAAEAPAEAAKKPAAKPTENTMWERLRGMGWRVETDAEGATLLYPPSKKSEKSKKSKKSKKETPAKAADKSLDQLLEERGWRVERSSDGTLTLYPQIEETAPAQAEKPVIEPAEGYVSSSAEVAQMDMPVNSWSEAKRIADSWLEVFGNGELRVGKIRKVLRVYVVSILEASPPYSLRHQIAVNTSDGRVVVLN